MTLVNIDLRNQGYETGPDDRVIFYSLLVREGEFGTISTAPVEVPLVDGKATVDLAPGPVGVQIIAGQVADTRVKEGRVPMEGPTTLNVVLTLFPEYSDAVRASFLAAIRGAQDEALTRIDAEVSAAVDGAISVSQSLADDARSKAANAVSVAESADLKASDAADRVSAIEILSGIVPGDVSDATVAGVVANPTSMTSGALERKIRQDAVGAAGIYGVMSDLPPVEATYRGVPVVWLKTVYNTIPEIQSLSLSMNGLTAAADFVGIDADGDDLNYHIDWGDGGITQNAESPAIHTYSAEGEYTVAVTVTDQWGASGAGVATIFVVPALPNRWAYDSFSYPDGTILAGWQSDTVKDPAYTTEIGGLTWQPGDQTTGLPTTAQKAHVRGGKFVQGTPPGTVEGSQRGIATLDLPSESYRVQVRYGLILDGQTSTLSNVTVYLSCSPVTQRNTTGTTSLAIRLGNSLNVAVSTVSNGTFTNVATKGVVPREGLLTATFNSATGAVTVAIDGDEFWSGTYAGPMYPKIGIDVRANAYLDDFEVAPL